MDINDRIARCRLIATLIVADDVVEEAELAFLENAMKRLSLTEEETARAMVLMEEDKAKAALSTLSDDDRDEFLAELARAAWVDGNLDEYEVELIERVATSMGRTDDDVKAALEAARPA